VTTLALFGFGQKGWGALLLLGMGVTLAVTAVALVIGALFGSLAAWAKLSNSRVARIFGDLYTTVFRGVPELLVIFLFYFGGSTGVSAIGHLFGYEGFIGFPAFAAGALAVGIISGAYQAEVFRGAFRAVARGEIEASVAMGMPRLLRFRRIVAPQVLRFAIPGLGNVWQLSLKDSALVSVTGLAELMRTAQQAAGSTRSYFEFYIAAAALYLVLTALSNRIVDRAEAHVARSFRRRIA
jgi:octopine/nopaline transport system permease protein